MEEPVFTAPFINIEYFFNKAYELFKGTPGVISDINATDISVYINYLQTALSILSILLIAGIIYSVVRIYEIRNQEAAKYHFAEPVRKDAGVKHERWEVVENHLNSNNAAEWRLAIIEADSILDDMVKKMGYDGESLGERLKAVEVSDFNSVQSAWEAHKVRNQIAHEGAGFELTQREAKRIIGLYESVFKEFEYI
ncbi:hypothetical protein ACFLY0_01310 [Patescibacteria group bacterium]